MKKTAIIFSFIFFTQNFTTTAMQDPTKDLQNALSNLEGKLRNLATDLDNLKKVPLKDTKKEIEKLVQDAQSEVSFLGRTTGSPEEKRKIVNNIFAIIEKVIATVNESSLGESFINKIVEDLRKVLNNVNKENESYDGQFLNPNDKNTLKVLHLKLQAFHKIASNLRTMEAEVSNIEQKTDAAKEIIKTVKQVIDTAKAVEGGETGTLFETTEFGNYGSKLKKVLEMVQGYQTDEKIDLGPSDVDSLETLLKDLTVEDVD